MPQSHAGRGRVPSVGRDLRRFPDGTEVAPFHGMICLSCGHRESAGSKKKKCPSCRAAMVATGEANGERTPPEEATAGSGIVDVSVDLDALSRELELTEPGMGDDAIAASPRTATAKKTPREDATQPVDVAPAPVAASTRSRVLEQIGVQKSIRAPQKLRARGGTWLAVLGCAGVAVAGTLIGLLAFPGGEPPAVAKAAVETRAIAATSATPEAVAVETSTPAPAATPETVVEAPAKKVVPAKSAPAKTSKKKSPTPAKPKVTKVATRSPAKKSAAIAKASSNTRVIHSRGGDKSVELRRNIAITGRNGRTVVGTLLDVKAGFVDVKTSSAKVRMAESDVVDAATY